MKTIQITKEHGSMSFTESVRVYEQNESKRDVMIDLINELESEHGVKTYECILGSGSERYIAPAGYGLVCVGAHFTSINERGNSVHRTKEIIAAYKL